VIGRASPRAAASIGCRGGGRVLLTSFGVAERVIEAFCKLVGI